MRIYTDHNGVAVNAISSLADGTDVEGHEYQILSGPKTTAISFQLGGVADNGVNGLTNEALMNVVLHRLKFLDAKFPCEENKQAIAHLSTSLAALESRTAGRMARGVEGQEVA